ncbi:MAG: hypothetical protein AAB343_00925 [Patescibacteria group bacterium]
MSSVVCFYHKDCVDGTAAAAVILKQFPDALTYPLSYQYTQAEITQILKRTPLDTTVYTVDCGLGVREFLERGYRVITLDHHIGMKEELEQLTHKYKTYTYVFNNNQSGATLSWSYLFPHTAQPQLLTYIEDGDLWKLNFPEQTKNVYYALSILVNQPERYIEYLDGNLAAMISEGATLTRYADFHIQKMCNLQPVYLHIGDFAIPAYNTVMYESAVGSFFSEKLGQAVALYAINGGVVKFGFRSREGQIPSALSVAQLFGGGGHEHASGATITLKRFISMIDLQAGGFLKDEAEEV